MTEKKSTGKHEHEHKTHTHTHTTHKHDTTKEKEKDKDQENQDVQERERSEREHGSGQGLMSHAADDIAEEQREQAQDLAKERGKDVQKSHEEALQGQERPFRAGEYVPPQPQEGKKGRKSTIHYRVKVKDGHHYENDANGIMQEYGPGKTFLTRHPLHKQHPEKFSLVREEAVQEEEEEEGQEGKKGKKK